MRTKTRSVTDTLVENILAVNSDEIPAPVTEVARMACLDGIGVMIAGTREPMGLGRLVTEWVRDMGGTPEAGVAAGGFKVPAMNAAFANGTLAHALDFDVYQHPRNHPMSPTLPAILALAEKRGHSGREVLSALVVAFEVQYRLRSASNGLRPGKGFHKPGTIGTIGATAACGWLLGLDPTQFANAFGIAVSRAGSFQINTGTMTKSSHSGHAARMGVECAELAARGWTASSGAFDEGGFFDTIVGEDQNPDLLVDDFGSPYSLVDPGIGFKKYPSQGWTQRIIEAALELRREHSIETRDVAAIAIEIPPFDFINRPAPSSGLDGKYSVQYAAVVSLLDGDVTIDSFSDARRFSADVDDMLSRVTVSYDPSIEMSSLKTLARVHVTLTDGTELTCSKQRIPGMLGIPLSETEQLAKFMSCTVPVIGAQRAEAIAALTDRLEELDTVSELIGLVAGIDAT